MFATKFTKHTIVMAASALGYMTFTHASELTIPNEFQANTPARAAQVNANFSATANAVNDNDARITAMQAALNALTARVAALESAPQNNLSVQYDAFYGTDLFFVRNDANGTVIIPSATGNQSPAESTATNYEYYPVPGLSNVAFEVANDGTTVILRTTGEAYLTSFSAWSQLEIAISVNGAIPAQGAKESLRMVSDDNLSSGGASWDVTLPIQLDAGSHEFTVMIRGSNQNQSEITIDGRSIDSYAGKVKASIMQIHDSN
ncbi:MAG: hypothetical protein HWE13_13720 [Gammaproteobacteria bacterium]|nr:hypothetical protein [Gammaproteobacteria bacterium]